MKKKSVLVGISGGIDSAMTAFILKEQGYKVTGVNFNSDTNKENQQEEKLIELKKKLGIEIIDYDASELFHKEVIGYFTNFHLQGKTPAPCSHCNPSVKWKLLVELADVCNVAFVATGHYVNIREENKLKRIFKGDDPKKDQSYYLWKLDQKVLDRAITPLGSFIKTELKKLAIEKGFGFLASGKESAGLCFSKGRGCEKLLQDYIPNISDTIEHGNIVNTQGEVIGRHKGYIYYTIGQKKGLDLNMDEKLCVAAIDASNNLLVADTWQNLYKKEFLIEDFYFPAPGELVNNLNIQTIIRGFGLNPQGNSRLTQVSDSHIRVELEMPAWALAPGQPAVFYTGNKLLGGGIVSASRLA
jgi:tRNA-specific 2-thiouridylase